MQIVGAYPSLLLKVFMFVNCRKEHFMPSCLLSY